MKEELITGVMQQMLPYLDNAQLKRLKQVMEQILFYYEKTHSMHSLIPFLRGCLRKSACLIL